MSSKTTVKLGEICDVRDGTHDSPKPKPNGHPLVTSKHIKNGSIDFSSANLISTEDFESVNKRSKVDKFDVLMSMIGTVGEMVFVDKEPEYAIKNIGLIKTGGNELLGKYLYYYLKSPQAINHLSSAQAGSTQKFIGLGELRKFPIELWDETSQEQIVKILGDIDRKIELNRRMNETLEQIGQTLFKHYFIDNPESSSWETKPLDEIADFKNGLACQKYPAKQSEQKLRVIKIKEMSSGFTDSSDTVGQGFPQDYIIENGDVLFAWSGTLMTKIWTEGPGALNQHIFKVTSQTYPKWFYYHWVNEHMERFVMIAKSKAVTMGHIKRSHLSEAKVKIPPSEYLQRYDEALSALLEQQIRIAVESNSLAVLSESLLPKLMSGEVKI